MTKAQEQREFFILDKEKEEPHYQWTDKRIARLKSYHKEHYSTAETAKMMHTTSTNINKKKEELKLGIKKTKSRNCLICGTQFWSWGNGNWQCSNCRPKDHWPF